MYQDFGAVVDHIKKTVQFKLFFPDYNLDPNQYFKEYILPNGDINKGDTPHIKSIKVIGDFQPRLASPGTAWDTATAPLMTSSPYLSKGYLYQTPVLQLNSDGYYQYKFAVTFENGQERICNDPCTKYHNFTPLADPAKPKPGEGDNSGFVVGGVTILPSGKPKEVTPLKGPRLPLNQLIIHELFLDDFTSEYRGNRAPLDAVAEKVNYLVELGVNAVEIMPVNGCPDGLFNWGYTPAYHFAVTNRYANDSARELEKLSLLKNFIGQLHAQGIHVILDVVLNHASNEFPYYQLYQDQDLSPYVSVIKAYGGKALDFYNNCTTEFIVDLCKYWLKIFKFDGIRLDCAKGYFIAQDKAHGLYKVLADLNDYIARNPALQNTALIIEYIDDNKNLYKCIDITNQVNATGCWFEPFLGNCFNYVGSRSVDKEIVRILASQKDFAPGKYPVTYIETHDHSRIVELIDNCSSKRDEWWRTQPYALALMTAAGAPLLYQGQEWAEVYWLPQPDWEEKSSGIKRVVSRPIHWDYSHVEDNATGKTYNHGLFEIYKKLIAIRKEHPACLAPTFYPEDYSCHFNAQGYGFDQDQQVIVYHKWDDPSGEKLIIVINFTNDTRKVNIPFSHNGRWRDLLSGHDYQIQDLWLHDQEVPTSWGFIFSDQP